jgi:hypothetical protein
MLLQEAQLPAAAHSHLLAPQAPRSEQPAATSPFQPGEGDTTCSAQHMAATGALVPCVSDCYHWQVLAILELLTCMLVQSLLVVSVCICCVAYVRRMPYVPVFVICYINPHTHPCHCCAGLMNVAHINDDSRSDPQHPFRMRMQMAMVVDAVRCR